MRFNGADQLPLDQEAPIQILTYRYFLAVAETGSVRQAAHDLHVSPSAISRQIQNLEHSFQTALFDRRSSGMFLTEEGRILEAHMRNTLREMDLAKSKIQEIHGLMAGTVRFATIEGVMRTWLSPAIARFQRQHGQVTFSGTVTGSPAVYDQLSSDVVDIGIAMEVDLPADIEVIERFPTHLIAVARPDHPLAGRDLITLDALVGYSLAMLNGSFLTRQLINVASARIGKTFSVVFEIDNIEMLKLHVQANGGMTILPSYAISQVELSRGDLVAIPVQDAACLACSTVLCKRRDRRMSHAARAFIETLRTVPMTTHP
ncbi:LysR family transcriptional regulator [uncultured Cobetia sp.]|uniref:LysR family transcriptional regulator n=1 Tax=uncultured Cobetia sp. TaxID=410706 RepID=UPI0030EE3785